MILTVAIVASLRAEQKEEEERELLSTAFIGKPKRPPKSGGPSTRAHARSDDRDAP